MTMTVNAAAEGVVNWTPVRDHFSNMPIDDDRHYVDSALKGLLAADPTTYHTL